MVEAQAYYDQYLRPILDRLGLKASDRIGGPTVPGILSQLIELGSPSQVSVSRASLTHDPFWKEQLADMATVLGLAKPEQGIKYCLRVYDAPAGEGRTVFTGSGKVVKAGEGVGRWHTFDVSSGLAGTRVRSIIRDNRGYLWFSSDNSGVSKYDGETFTTFAEQTGQPINLIKVVFRDSKDQLWFGS